MFSFGYRDRKWRIIKDICFLLIGAFLIWKGRFFGVLIGAGAISWYGYDLYLQFKLRKMEKEQQAAASQPQQQASPQEQENGRITITDLSGVKEAKFEKE